VTPTCHHKPSKGATVATEYDEASRVKTDEIPYTRLLILIFPIFDETRLTRNLLTSFHFSLRMHRIQYEIPIIMLLENWWELLEE